MEKVLITPINLINTDGPHVTLLRDAGFEIIYTGIPRLLTEDEILDRLSGCRAVLASSEPYTPKVMDAHPQLRIIARHGVGFDAVNVPAATERNIAVTTTPGSNQDAVAEHVFALMLGVVKNVIRQHEGTKIGKWPRGVTMNLRGQTLGIVGLGRIGKAVAVRAAAFQMPMMAYELYPDEAFCEQYNIKLVSLEDLFRQADMISLHVPYTPESKHMINKDTLALMKPTSYLINTARGGLVCEKDLLEALQTKRLAGAGLDVFETEPPLPGPLFELENVILTPHAAGVDMKSRMDMAVAAAQAIVKLSRGEWPEGQVVNPEVKETFQW
ncbi:MAG: phosphoglycerate dehydrogenase [Gemmataceae bacterium]